jgi:hypothetical protein
MAIPGNARRGYAPHEVDLMDIPTVGALYRLGPHIPTAEERAEQESMNMLAARVAAARRGDTPPGWE